MNTVDVLNVVGVLIFIFILGVWMVSSFKLMVGSGRKMTYYFLQKESEISKNIKGVYWVGNDLHLGVDEAVKFSRLDGGCYVWKIYEFVEADKRLLARMPERAVGGYPNNRAIYAAKNGREFKYG